MAVVEWPRYSLPADRNLPFPIGERVFRTVGNVTFRLPYRRRPPFVSIVKTSPADGKEQKLQTKGKRLKLRYKMLKIALLDYVPQRYMRKANFETQETDRFLLGFKAGQRFAFASLPVASARTTADISGSRLTYAPSAEPSTALSISKW